VRNVCLMRLQEGQSGVLPVEVSQRAERGSLDHEARRLRESQTRFFEVAYEEYNWGQGCELLASIFSEDLLKAISRGADHSR
jgi:hypothetical protein